MACGKQLIQNQAWKTLLEIIYTTMTSEMAAVILSCYTLE